MGVVYPLPRPRPDAVWLPGRAGVMFSTDPAVHHKYAVELRRRRAGPAWQPAYHRLLSRAFRWTVTLGLMAARIQLASADARRRAAFYAARSWQVTPEFGRHLPAMRHVPFPPPSLLDREDVELAAARGIKARRTRETLFHWPTGRPLAVWDAGDEAYFTPLFPTRQLAIPDAVLEIRQGPSTVAVCKCDPWTGELEAWITLVPVSDDYYHEWRKTCSPPLPARLANGSSVPPSGTAAPEFSA